MLHSIEAIALTKSVLDFNFEPPPPFRVLPRTLWQGQPFTTHNIRILANLSEESKDSLAGKIIRLIELIPVNAYTMAGIELPTTTTHAEELPYGAYLTLQYSIMLDSVTYQLSFKFMLNYEESPNGQT